jgi:hypothetical protein
VSKLKWIFLFAIAVWGVLFAVAYAAAPKSCHGGQEAYFFAGVAAALVLMATPLFAHTSIQFWKRALLSAAFGVVTVAIWLGGFFAADFQLLCKLF